VDLNDDNKITEKIFKEGIYYESHRDRFSIKVRHRTWNSPRKFGPKSCAEILWTPVRDKSLIQLF
jgi:hypothetical protein